MMTGAFDFRDPNNPDTKKMPDHMDVTLKDFPDELYYKRVTRGVDETPMAPWGSIFPHLYLWKAEAYARTFHDPLDQRTAKKPIPPCPHPRGNRTVASGGTVPRSITIIIN